MARLTENGKRNFLELVLKSTFAARKEALKTKSVELAEAVYLSQGEERVALLKSLPDGVLAKSLEIKCYFGGQSYTLYLPEAVPQAWPVHYNRYRFAVDHPITEQFEALNRMDDQIEKEERELKKQVRALLDNCSTDKQLLATWPEAAEFLPQGTIENLPAPLTENLNKMIADLRSKS